MDLTPKTHLVNALSKQNATWEKMIAELVDNSFDAGASRVDVILGPGKRVEVIDDGGGCKDIAAMLTFGDHRPHQSTRLGRYGIGLKDAALFLKGVTEIDTVCKGRRSQCVIDWNKLERSDSWVVPDPMVTDTDSASGTRIRFSGFNRGTPNAKTQAEKLGWTFSPAIQSGSKIRVVAGRFVTSCVPFRLPQLTDGVVTEFDVNGRGVRLQAGIVPDGIVNPYPGFTFQHGHRTLMYSALGAKHCSVSRIAGVVELDSKWSLTKNKDDITEHQDELADAIYLHCEAILRKADLQSQQLESYALNSSVNEVLNTAIRNIAGTDLRREKRDRPDDPTTGTVTPKNTGRKRRNAEKTSDKAGQIERAIRRGLTLDWTDQGSRIGTADLPGGRVCLNSEMPFLKELRTAGMVNAIAAFAFAVFVNEVNKEDEHRHRYLPGMQPEEFIDVWSSVVSQIPGQTDKPSKRKAS